MENKFIFQQGMDIDADDFNAVQDYAQQTFDDIVNDGITPNSRYAGFAVTKTSATAVQVAPGRLYSGGKVYAQTVTIAEDFISSLPVAGQKIVSVVLLGSEVDTSVTAREFLIDQTTGASQPKSVATQHARIANVTFAQGAESPSAVAPLIQTGYTKVADILLTTSGVYSITMYAPNQLVSAENLSGRVSAIETWEAVVGPEVTSLTSGLASLAKQLASGAITSTLTSILLSIADLDAKVGIPSTAQLASADYLLDGTNSDLSNVLSSCNVMEGVRFPWDGYATSVLNLFNPFEPNGTVDSGVLFAAYDLYLRLSTGPRSGTVNANSYTYDSVSYVQQTTTQQRITYGTPFDVCTNSAFWQSGTYNPLTSIFTLPDGETYRAAADNLVNGSMNGYLAADGVNVISHTSVRMEQFWTDSVSSTYWTAVFQAPQPILGFHLFETMLIGQDQWLGQVGVTLGNLDAQGDVTVIVTEAGSNAIPDPSLVLSKVTIPYASLRANAENLATLAVPVLLSAGKRISIGVITPAAHQVATTSGSNFPQGTFFTLSPSGFASADLTKHLCLNLYSCKFRNSSVSIQLQNLQLAGGVTGIQILAPTIIPQSTTLIYEIQLAGVWVPLNANTVGQLNTGGSMPPNVPIRVTMSGTPDMMPSLSLTGSQVSVMRPGMLFKHVWPKLPRTPPVASQHIGVLVNLQSFNPAFHSCTINLMTGAGYTTLTAPSSFSDATNADGTITRTFIFNLGATITSYKVETIGTTSTALNTFLVGWIKDYAL